MGKKKASKGDKKLREPRKKPKRSRIRTDEEPGRGQPKRRRREAAADFQEPDDPGVFHEASCEVQDFSQFAVEEPKYERPEVNTEDIMRSIEARISPKIEEALQNYMDRYLYAELERRFKELTECVAKQETQQKSDWSVMEEIKNRLDRIEATQQKLLQHQMELELEMVCNKCGRTIPEDAGACPYCSGADGGADDDFYENNRDYERRREPKREEYGEPPAPPRRRRREAYDDFDDDDFNDDDEDDFIATDRDVRRGKSVDELQREFERMGGSFERIPVQEYGGDRDYMNWDDQRSRGQNGYDGGRGYEGWDGRGGYDGYDGRGGHNDYDPASGSRQTYQSTSSNYDPSPKAGAPQQPAGEPAGPPPGCPSCYRPLEYVAQYDAYYCRHCSGYLDMSTRKLVRVGPSGEKKRSSSKKYSDSSQKLEDVVSYIEYDPEKEARKQQAARGRGKEKKRKGLFGFGKK